MDNDTSQSLNLSYIQALLGAYHVSLERRCIYSVPKLLREINKEAYTPTNVSIGPLHYMDDSLHSMEVHKLKYLESFKNACQINENAFISCLQVVKDKETQLRICYANSTNHISSGKFTQMVFIDSVFIIELFRRFFNPSLRKDDTYIWGNPYMYGVVKRDIILVENQLPFFILKDLYWTAFKPHDGIVPYFTDLACAFLDINEHHFPIDNITNEAKCFHLLDLQRSCCLPYDETSVPVGIDGYEDRMFMICPTATSLHEAGVKFQVTESSTSSWIHVDFDSITRILTIPKLQVTDKTESYLRNLIAFEQCHYIHHSTTYISDYLVFLDCLIKTPEDVQLLANTCIIENSMASEKDVSDLVSSLRKHVRVKDPYYYSGITDQLNVHCNNKCKRCNKSLALISAALSSSEAEENDTCQSMGVSCLQPKVDALQVSLKRRCIYRVPKLLRKVNKEAYTPVHVSIGPLHYMDDNLRAMEVHKHKYLKSFLHACQINKGLSRCLQVVNDKETQLRESYAHSTIHISSEDFTWMIFIDSVFIIEFFRRSFDDSLIENDDHIWGDRLLLSEVRRDIHLVENQLPFFILKQLYLTAFIPEGSTDIPCFMKLAYKFLDINMQNITNKTTCFHLLDLLRSSCLPSKETLVARIDENGNTMSMMCPTATSLYEAGVKFRVTESGASSWINIDFDSNRGILTIPKLQVTDNTDSFLRNLIAFEKCHYLHHSETYVSDYLVFLDCLIKTPEDVQLLSKACIIENLMAGEEDVCDLVSSIRKHVRVTQRYYYGGISDQLNIHCNKRWNSWTTIFKKPWALIPTVLLTLTVIKGVIGKR